MAIENKQKQTITATDKETPAISIIVPAYNTEKYIEECLDSVLAQTFQDYEVICIDDGSTDKSLSIFKKYAAKDLRVKVMSQKNEGVVSARNNAIAVARGKYIFPLDSDDVIVPNCLEVLYDFITTHDYAVVCPSGQYFGDITKKCHWTLPNPTKWNMYRMNNGIHNSSLYLKKFWEKYGGYDHTFDTGTEDFDFWLNFLDDGQKIIRLPDRLFYYRLKPLNESRNKQTDRKLFKENSELIRANLKRKHPKIIKYMRWFKIIKIPRTIIRFFFRWETSKRGYFRVRIFKIPVYWREIA